MACLLKKIGVGRRGDRSEGGCGVVWGVAVQIGLQKEDEF